ncbi:MAG: helix-turn-helix domain-containing protein [Streptosporangiaceae bacterium]
MMPGDELAARRAARDQADGGIVLGPDGGWMFPSEAMERRGEHLKPEVRKALDQMSMVDQVIRFWAMGGCQETGGAHVPDRLVAQLVQCVVAGLGVMERRNGGLPRSARELAAWVADQQRSSGVHPDATVEPHERDQGIGTAEAATILRCTQHHVWVLTRRRFLDAKKIGGVLVLRRRQVIELAERRPDASGS